MSVTTLDKLGHDLNALVKGVGKSAKRAIAKQVAELPFKFRAEATAFFPKVMKVRTGNLRNSISPVSQRTGASAWTIGLSSDKEYAAIQEYGGHIPPHGISAKPGRIGRDGRPGRLKFVIGGETLYRRRVHHPGGYIKPKRFLRHPIQKEAEKALAQMRKEIGFDG